MSQSPCWPRSRSGVRRFLLSIIGVVLFGVLLTGCPPAVVRQEVPAANVIKASELVREADLVFARKDLYAALIKYLEAGRLNPNSEYTFNKIGIVYSQLKLYPDAITAFQRSIALNPKYPYSYNNLGTVYFARDEKKKAGQYFRRAIGLDGKVASFHINLGTLYFEQKQFDKGIAEWRKGLAIDPAALGKSEGISLAAATGRGTTSERSYFMARVFAAMGDAERAVDNLQQAVNAGFLDIEAVRREPDFDSIRQNERFLAFMKTFALLTKK